VACQCLLLACLLRSPLLLSLALPVPPARRDWQSNQTLNVSRESLPELDVSKEAHRVPVDRCPGACSDRSACMFNKVSNLSYCAK
jgi:hypothetical protein